MTNFDIFSAIPQFDPFASVVVSAERIQHIDPSACVLNCRRAMEFAVKWMYSVDNALVMPYQDTLVSLMNTEDFRDIVGADIWRRMDLIRRMGNNAAHIGKKITEEQAVLCLENLYVFLDFVAYCYGENYAEGHFDRALLTEKSEASAAPMQEAPEVDLAALMAENAALKEKLTAHRAEQQQTYVPKPLDLSEYKTRKLYINTMLTDAGWTEGSVQDEDGKFFTCGHFDLVICDEAHRSVYNKYRDIFNYFDAPLVGLTATPKDEIDKNTYEIFELENGVPTYGYELAQAVKDGYLVDFLSVETKLKFIEQGIVYDELSDADKEAYEDTFTDENGELPESIASSALNEWIFNEDTIRQVLHTLMTHGLTIDYGSKLGKTIIFAKNHTHAEKILTVFNKEYEL